MKIATVGLDLAKTLFQVHGVDSRGFCCSKAHVKIG